MEDDPAIDADGNVQLTTVVSFKAYRFLRHLARVGGVHISYLAGEFLLQQVQIEAELLLEMAQTPDLFDPGPPAGPGLFANELSAIELEEAAKNRVNLADDDQMTP